MESMRCLIVMAMFLFVLSFLSLTRTRIDEEDYLPKRFTLFSYNLKQSKFGDLDQENRALHFINTFRKKWVGEEVQKRPDVLVLQEVEDEIIQEELANMKDWYPYQTPILGRDCDNDKKKWNRITGRCDRPGSWAGSGIQILSKYQITSQSGLYFKNYHNESKDSTKVKGAICISIITNSKEKYNIINTHMQSDPDGETSPKVLNGFHQVRQKQLKEIKQWINSLKLPKNEPVIIAGDLGVPLYPKIEGLSNHHVKNMQKALNATFKFKPKSPTVIRKVGSFSCPNNILIKLALANRNPSSQAICREKHLDYILVMREHLQEVTPSRGLSVMRLKSRSSMYWENLNREFPFPVNGYDKTSNGTYYDLSDHFPVYQGFHFYQRESN